MPATAATPAAAFSVVTPIINEFEQACGDCDVVDGQRVLLHQDKGCREIKEKPLIPTLGDLIDAALPRSSFCSPAATADVAGDETLKNYIGHDPAHESIDSLASLAAAALSPTKIEPRNFPKEGPQEDSDDADDVVEAAGILCNFKKSSSAVMDCYSRQEAFEILEMVVEMLTDETQQDSDDYESQNLFERPRENGSTTANVIDDSLVHPDRLSTEDDAEEVNQLHQYVRKDLLEIFAVPQANSAAADSDDEDDQDDEEENSGAIITKSSNVTTPSNVATAAIGTRRLVTRGRSITLNTSSPPLSQAAQRHYPGRVGLRCVHCAHVRRRDKSASKAAFYPLRLKNIYREVCAWQRIHFKKCAHVPMEVRERYDHYKRIDTSRGKVRYWETSARRIGLQNNPNREDGVVFAQTAWRA